MKHTPGPWNAFKYPDVKSWTVTAKESIASKIKKESDARLIAAAPEMFEVLEVLVDRLLMDDMSGYGDDQVEAIYSAVKVLKKARGEL